MDRFLTRFRSQITGVLSGFDRLVFRGHLIPLIRPRGMYAFLVRAGVRLLDFKAFVSKTSAQVKEAALADAHRDKRPIQYLLSSKTDKEELVRRLLIEHPIREGLVCAMTTVEPCMSFEYHRSENHDERGLKLRPRKCLHVYRYFLHPAFGLIGTRLQTWFPFSVQIWLNGREWLSHLLESEGSRFKRSDNCFTWLADPKHAQRLMNRQLKTDWPHALDRIARSLNPLHRAIFKPWPMNYYWSTYQCEWATDLLFVNPRALAEIFPSLTRHAMLHFQSPDVMRFLGRKAHGNFTGELTTSFKDRAEGVRVKHWINGNSIKMYDKAGSVLRVETTIGRTADFKVFRPALNDPHGKLHWKPLRKGVADLHRLAELSQRSNERYLEALTAVQDTTPCATLFDLVARPVVDDGRRVRALRIGDPDDIALLQTISRGEFATAGFRNRDIRRRLHPGTTSPDDTRRLSARTGRRLRLLRAHHLIRKLQKTHRYVLTERGQLLTAALFAVRQVPLDKLLAKAA